MEDKLGKKMYAQLNVATTQQEMILYRRLLLFHLLSFIPISAERIRTVVQERLSSMARKMQLSLPAAQAGQHHHVGGAHTAADGTTKSGRPKFS